MYKPKAPQQLEALPDTAAYEGLVRNIAAAIAPLNALHRQAVAALAPSVREILQNRSQDSRQIERTLDHLLDHACIPEGLTLFKSLCRHYYTFNPMATATYVYTYRDMWDSEGECGDEAGYE